MDLCSDLFHISYPMHKPLVFLGNSIPFLSLFFNYLNAKYATTIRAVPPPITKPEIFPVEDEKLPFAQLVILHIGRCKLLNKTV